MNPRDHSWWKPPAETKSEHYGKLAERARLRLSEQPSLRADPPRRADGRCVNCRRDRPVIAVKDGDPFCSNECARTWHDQLAASPSIGG
jgi:hypothetical protein